MSSLQKQCEQIELLISADLDGELSFDDVAKMKSHLSECLACRQKREHFLQINDSIHELGLISPTTAAVDPGCAVAPEKDASWLWRLIPISLAASLLVLFGLMILPAEPNPVNAQEIINPFTDVLEINERSERDQRVMLKTLELELRSMRLELAQLNELGQRGAELANRLGTLIEQVKQLENSNDLENTGDN